MTRDWKPLTDKWLDKIIADTIQDNPEGVYCADDVYRLAMEVKKHREAFKPLPEPPTVSPKKAAKIALYLEYIAWRLRVG